MIVLEVDVESCGCPMTLGFANVGNVHMISRNGSVESLYDDRRVLLA